MDINLVLLSGRLAAVPELRTLESGGTLLRYLVTLRSEYPERRVDVVPVVVRDPEPDLVAERPAPGQWIWAVANLRRRFWPAGDGRRSRLELVATQVSLRGDPDSAPFPCGSAGPDAEAAMDADEGE